MAIICKTNGSATNGHHHDQQTSKKLLFAFFPIEGHGHINPSVSMANALRDRGHDTVFLCINDIGYTGHRVVCLKKLMEEEDDKEPQQKETTLNTDQKVSQADKAMTKRMDAIQFGDDPAIALKNVFSAFTDAFQELLDPKWDKALKDTILDMKPDVVVVDHAVVPAIMNPANNLKWVRVVSTNPMVLYAVRRPDLMPAPSLGAPTKGLSEKERELTWKTYLEGKNVLRPTTDRLRELAGLGPEIEHDPAAESPHLNLYIYPRELDYDQEFGITLPNWVRIQSMNRPNKHQQLFGDRQNNNTTINSLLSSLDIPEELRDFIQQDDQQEKKKLIYLSLGTIACMDVDRMKRLVSLFAKTPYKLIVSKGARHEEFDLAPNMWGAKHVPQREILLLVDLVITHGGNNTITECLYSGVPGIIVCPMFCDQYDNATRMEEKRLGVRVDLGKENSEENLLKSIEKVLADKEMRENIRRVSSELRQPNDGPEKAAEVLEKLALA